MLGLGVVRLLVGFCLGHGFFFKIVRRGDLVDKGHEIALLLLHVKLCILPQIFGREGEGVRVVVDRADLVICLHKARKGDEGSYENECAKDRPAKEEAARNAAVLTVRSAVVAEAADGGAMPDKTKDAKRDDREDLCEHISALSPNLQLRRVHSHTVTAIVAIFVASLPRP